MGSGDPNVLLLSGDHQSFGNDPQAKNVYDVDSVQVIKIMADLQKWGRFLTRQKGKDSSKVFHRHNGKPLCRSGGITANTIEKKIKAGAQFVQTQSIYDIDRFERWMEKVRSGIAQGSLY